MPIFAVFLAFLAATGTSSHSADSEFGTLPTQDMITASGSTPWPLSPRAECERQEIDASASTPPYCNGLTARGKIPEDAEQALILAREILINLQLAFGDNRYDARATLPGTFPLTSLNFSRQLAVLTKPAKLKPYRQNALSYLDKDRSKQWIARDLEACAFGGSVAGRVQDRGKIGQTDAGDLLSIGEFSCLDPRFSSTKTPPSFWLYEVVKRDHDQMELAASGKMQRDLPGLSLQASIPETTLLLDADSKTSLHYKDAAFSYCIGWNAPDANATAADCNQIAVLFEHINMTMADLEQGMQLKDIGRFSIAFERELANAPNREPVRYDIFTENLASWPGQIMPHQGTVIIMGRHDARLMLRFQRNGSATMTRELNGGISTALPTRTAAELYAYAGWLQNLPGQPAQTPSDTVK